MTLQVLKGPGCSLLWPTRSLALRPSADLDPELLCFCRAGLLSTAVTISRVRHRQCSRVDFGADFTTEKKLPSFNSFSAQGEGDDEDRNLAPRVESFDQLSQLRSLSLIFQPFL